MSIKKNKITQKERNQKTELSYKKFIELYDQHKNSFIFRKMFETRLVNKNYKSTTYNKINILMEWFIKNYDLSIYKLDFHMVNYNGLCWLYIINKDKRELFIRCFPLKDKDKIELCFYDNFDSPRLREIIL